MKTYYVTYPTAGSISVAVEADSEEEAIEKGYDHLADDDAEHTWEALERIVQGNIFYGECNEISVECEDCDDEDED